MLRTGVIVSVFFLSSVARICGTVWTRNLSDQRTDGTDVIPFREQLRPLRQRDPDYNARIKKQRLSTSRLDEVEVGGSSVVPDSNTNGPDYVRRRLKAGREGDSKFQLRPDAGTVESDVQSAVSKEHGTGSDPYPSANERGVRPFRTKQSYGASGARRQAHEDVNARDIRPFSRQQDDGSGFYPYPSASTRESYPSDLCGVWQDGYTTLHRAIRDASRDRLVEDPSGLQGTPRVHPRFLTFTSLYPDCGGLGDALLGLATSFLIAYLDQRAFLIDHKCFLYAFQPAFIDWVPSGDIRLRPLKDLTNTAFRRNKAMRWNKIVRQTDAVFFNLLNKEVNYQPFFSHVDNASNVVVQWNRGRLVRMLSNGVGKGSWSTRLKKMGLTIPYALGCILRFILKPQGDVTQMVSSAVNLLRTPHARSVCVHVRLSDDVYRGRKRKGSMQSATEMQLREALDCAQKLENFWLPPSLHVMWVVFSNLAAVKERAKLLHPDKVVVSDIQPVHNSFVGDEADRRSAFKATVAEWLLFGECDKFVVRRSGFSTTAVQYAMKPLSMFHQSRCDPQMPLTMTYLGNDWSGV